MPYRRVLVSMVCLVSMACGGNPGAPTGGGGSSKGTLTATVDGVAYTGTVNTATNLNGILTVASVNAALTLSINFATTPVVGTVTISFGVPTSMSVIATSGGTVTGSWGASGLAGNGTLTITTLTATGAAGTFRFDGAPLTAGTTGTKVVTNGAFNVTF